LRILLVHIISWLKISLVSLWLIVGLCLCQSHYCYSQASIEQEDFGEVITDIEERLQKGQRLALRDLAYVWKQQPQDKGILYMAQRYLLLTPEEFDWTAEDLPQQLLNLYYDREKELKFSEFLAYFYITPIENRSVQTKIREWNPPTLDLYVIEKIKKNIDFALDKKKYQALKETISLTGKVDQTVTASYLNKLLVDKRFLKIKPRIKRQELIQLILQNLPTSQSIELVFELVKHKTIDLSFGQTLLADFTNHSFKDISEDSLRTRWSFILTKQNDNLELVRETGYANAHPAKPFFFEDPVDYYGWIIATTDGQEVPWIHHNALVDMINTNHPKVLFYLAGLQYRAWKVSKETTYLDLLKKMADVRVSVPNQAGIYTEDYTDPVAQLNFLTYWSQHYTDYEWSNTSEELFVNMDLKSELIDSYERYFRRLNSPNDSAALVAFNALTEGIPEEVNRLMKKYRTLLRTYNASLPPLKFNIIENICFLTAYCRQHDFNYMPSASLRTQLEKLTTPLSHKTRLKLENRLIESLSLEDVTTLEYYAAIRANNIQLNFSIGRILDYVYDKNWPSIVQEEQQLRLYLLKTGLFKKLTSFGVARLYHNKIPSTDSQVQLLLKEIAQSESNEFIQEAISSLNKESDTHTATVKLLVEDPESFNVNHIIDLPKFTQEELEALLNKLKEIKNRKAIKKIGTYMTAYASTDMIPSIFKSPSEDWMENKSASKIIIKLLEHIYGYNFSKDTDVALQKWYQLWNDDQQDYSNWGKRLFDLQLEELTTETKLGIKNINSITQSVYYQPQHRTACLSALTKIKKVRTISQLQLSPSISIKEELGYLENLDFSYRDLDNLNKIVEVDDPSTFLDFILLKSTDFSIDQKGFLFNNLLRQKWLFQLVNNKEIQEEQVNTILNYLTTYLEESEYMSEFEEQASHLNILLLAHYKDTDIGKLMLLNDPTVEESVKLKWLEIITARVTFEDLPEILTTIQQVEGLEPSLLFSFLSRDFGLPIYNWDQEDTFSTFEKQLNTLPPLALYQQYLEKLGIDIKNKRDKLDFHKIYRLLQFDLIVPFLGEGGQYRDYYMYTLVKILELHFNTTLNFSPKLNEYQTFFQFNSFARVNAWKEYLIENKHVKKEKIPWVSFNERED